MPNGIFISYRQDDAKPWALLLREELVEAFGENQVFLDKDTLHAGSWRQQIERALARCKVVLVVMGRKWLSIADEHGQRRLDRADDVHRQEIAYALSRPDLTVIPVRVDGAPIPRPEQLPPEIRALGEQQARNLSDSSAHRQVDLKLLVADIERATGLSDNTRTSSVEQTAPHAGRTSSTARFRASARTLLLAALASLLVVTGAEILLGWSLDAAEKSLLAIFILIFTLGAAWLRNRGRGKRNE